MFGLGYQELLLILVIVLILFGAQRLPDLARSLGSSVKESLFFHAAALGEIQDKVVIHLREKKEIGPADVKDLLGVSRKYAIPLMEYFDSQRVTVRQGERRVLRTP